MKMAQIMTWLSEVGDYFSNFGFNIEFIHLFQTPNKKK